MPAQSTNLILALFTLLAIVSQTSQRSHPPVVCVGSWSFSDGIDEGTCSIGLPQESTQLNCVKSKCYVPNRKDQLVTMAGCYTSDGKGPTKQDCSQYAYLPSSKAFGCENQDSYTCNENPDGIAYIECPYTACHSE